MCFLIYLKHGLLLLQELLQGFITLVEIQKACKFKLQSTK